MIQNETFYAENKFASRWEIKRKNTCKIVALYIKLDCTITVGKQFPISDLNALSDICAKIQAFEAEHHITNR